MKNNRSVCKTWEKVEISSVYGLDAGLDAGLNAGLNAGLDARLEN